MNFHCRRSATTQCSEYLRLLRILPLRTRPVFPRAGKAAACPESGSSHHWTATERRYVRQLPQQSGGGTPGHARPSRKTGSAAPGLPRWWRRHRQVQHTRGSAHAEQVEYPVRCLQTSAQSILPTPGRDVMSIVSFLCLSAILSATSIGSAEPLYGESHRCIMSAKWLCYRWCFM